MTTRSAPSVRAAQARRRRERHLAAGVCAWPGACPDPENPTDPTRRRPASPSGPLCPDHAAEGLAATRRTRAR